MRKERYYEDDFNGFVEEIINSSRLEGKEAGIAKQMLDKGYDSLSEKQRYIFDKSIENNTIDECQRCGVDIPLFNVKMKFIPFPCQVSFCCNEVPMK